MRREQPRVWLPGVWQRALPAQTGLAELYHENSRYHRAVMYRVGPQSPHGEHAAAAPPASPGPAVLLLPPGKLTMTIGEALHSRSSLRSYDPTALTAAQLSTLLAHAAGPGRYPSAGGRYAISVCLLAKAVDGLPAGGYRYSPAEQGLLPLPVDPARIMAGLLPPGDPAALATAPLLLLLVADFASMAVKYGARGYRFCLQECGHIAQNVQLVTAAMGLGSLVMGAYLDDELDAGLGLDGVERTVLTVMPVGYGGDA
ncbi:MAG: thiopeptide-type bacteriocin biosynthesis domain protein [Firmicutes bacterium]|nr:thiopeptide-type bacteriocin biosynthesis domain protein [Bacillota bacterium]